MKKILLFIFILAGLHSSLFADQEYILGNVNARQGKVRIFYVIAERAHIRIHLEKENTYVKVYVLQDMKTFREYIDKFVKWHAIAVENNSKLNKKIGDLYSFSIEFITVKAKYEAAFVNESGMRLMTFDINNLKRIKELITDENIDLIINEDKRKKQKEDELFK